jgi:signal transduction histidine kinase
MYVVGGKLGLDLAYINKSASAVWPPTGIALAAFLLCGDRVWPAVFVGAFIVNLTTAGSVATSLAIAAGNTLEGWIGARLVSRYAGGQRVFERVGDILRYVVLAAGIATAVSATVGTVTLLLAHLAPWRDVREVWLTWWLGDATAATLLAPALVLSAIDAPPRWTIAKIGEGFLLLFSVIGVAAIVFLGLVMPPQFSLCFPLPLWAAFRFGRREAAMTVLLFSIFAVWGTINGAGPFLRPTPHASILVLQTFMGGLGVMSLIVAAVVAAQQRVERELRAARAELEETVASLSQRTGELVRSNESLKQFAYAASHDLQEPARTIGNYAEILVRRYRGKLDANADEFLGYVSEGANWMQQLLEGLLEYSRIERRQKLPSLVLMDRALDQALHNLGAAIEESRARITRGTLPAVWADQLQMIQVFQNLVGNAVKFRRPGVPPEIEIEAWPLETEWVIAVRDNGIGIDPRFKERMFAIFQRLHPRHEYPGTGVGLAICRKIVELHGGRIWAEPRGSGGSTLLFTLPRNHTENP